jgi:cation transport regulator
MPYATNEDLPPTLRRSLPAHAQDIYREAFNHAWRQYADNAERQEEITHRVAWAAVKKRYRKRDGLWTAIEIP